MLVEEIIILAKGLPRVDQIRIAEALVETEYEKKEREFVESLEGVTEIPIWSPFDSCEAAAALMKHREEAERGQ